MEKINLLDVVLQAGYTKNESKYCSAIALKKVNDRLCFRADEHLDKWLQISLGQYADSILIGDDASRLIAEIARVENELLKMYGLYDLSISNHFKRKGIIMTKQEFESRVKFTVSDEVFERIHDLYISTDVDKDVFCKNFNWKEFAEYVSKGYANTTKVCKEYMGWYDQLKKDNVDLIKTGNESLAMLEAKDNMVKNLNERIDVITKEAGKLAEGNLFLERYAKVLEERIERLKKELEEVK